MDRSKRVTEGPRVCWRISADRSAVRLVPTSRKRGESSRTVCRNPAFDRSIRRSLGFLTLLGLANRRRSASACRTEARNRGKRVTPVYSSYFSFFSSSWNFLRRSLSRSSISFTTTGERPLETDESALGHGWKSSPGSMQSIMSSI